MKTNKNQEKQSYGSIEANAKLVDQSYLKSEMRVDADSVEKVQFLEEKLAKVRSVMLAQQREILEMKERLNVYELSWAHSFLRKLIRFFKL